MIYRDNISPHNKYGIFGSGKGTGMPTINYYFPGAIITNNVMAGGPARLYPPDNFFPHPWKTSASSIWRVETMLGCPTVPIKAKPAMVVTLGLI